MHVDYITHSGDDLLVVNAARVSFDKHKDEFGDDDNRLLSYLARNSHWTPFAHPQITLRMTAPVPIRTQCFKHKQGFTENEVSRRYVEDEPEFFIPDVWRGKPIGGAKQGSSDSSIEILRVKMGGTVTVTQSVQSVYEHALDTYTEMIEAGVCPEQARFVLPQGMLTSWYWTGSLAAYARFYKQRTDPHAQKEISDLAVMVGSIIAPLYPVSWEALNEVSSQA